MKISNEQLHKELAEAKINIIQLEEKITSIIEWINDINDIFSFTLGVMLTILFIFGVIYLVTKLL